MNFKYHILKTGLMTGVICAAFIFGNTVIRSAHACSCAEPTEQMAMESYTLMDYVIEAEVISKANAALNRPPQVTVDIKRVYKGDLTAGATAVFAYNSTLSACGLNPEVGDVITVGAFDAPNSQPRLAHKCAQMAIRKFLIMNGGYPR